jgi:hypothetical protein
MRNSKNVLIESVSEKKRPEKSQKLAKEAGKKPVKGHKMAKNDQKMAKNDQKMAKNPQSLKKIDQYFCEFCSKEFKTYQNKRRHELHRCRHNNAVMERNLKMKDKELLQLKKQHNDEKNEYKKHIELLLTKVGNTTITTNNIQLNNYGNEDMSHISESFKTELLKIPYGMIPKMIEAVHFNTNKPENKNILLTNKKDNKLKIYSGGKWVYKNKEEILKKLIDGKYFVMDEHYEYICNKIDNFKNIHYEDFRKKYDANNKEILNNIKVKSELILLNNR